MKLTYDGLIKLSFGIALLILVLIGGIFYWTTHRLLETNLKVLDTLQVVENLNGLLAGIYQGESSARGFIVSGEAEDLDSYQVSVTEVQEAIRSLEGEITNTPDQKARFENLKSAINQKLGFSSRKIELRQSLGFESSRTYFLTNRDRALMDNISATISEIKDDEVLLLHQRRSQADKSAKRLISSLILGLTFSFFMFLAVFYHLNREIARRREAEGKAIKLNEDLRTGRSQPAAGKAEPGGGARQPHEERVPRPNEPRVAHPLECDHRIFGPPDGRIVRAAER
jgi:CHASE3 domain sensor protein